MFICASEKFCQWEKFEFVLTKKEAQQMTVVM